jgi:hypothetical protein
MSPNNAGQTTIVELKRQIIANAIATGNTFAFRDLFSRLAEMPDLTGDSAMPPELLHHLRYLLPADESPERPELKDAREFIREYEFDDNTIPAAVLEETAKRAVKLGKFAFAEDAYKLLGIKKEIVALYAQTGEQFLRDGKATRGAMSFFAAASIDQPVVPHFQRIGPQLHAKCLGEPDKCVTTLTVEEIIDKGLDMLLANEPLSEKLLASARPDDKREILAALSVCRDMDLLGLVKNLQAAASELSGVDNGQPDDYTALGPMLLGRETGSGEAWQYLRELCFEHPIGSLCVCIQMVKDTPVLVPVIRDGKPLIELLLPQKYLY